MPEDNKYYRLKRPEYPLTIGQGNFERGMKITVNGGTIVLEFGTVFKLADFEGIALFPDNGYPKISKEFLQKHFTSFEEVV